MWIAYVVCLVALLQITLYSSVVSTEETPSSIPTLSDSSSDGTTPTNSSATDSEEPSTSTEEVQTTTELSSTSDTKVETMPYTEAVDTTTKSTEVPQPATTSKPGHAALVYPNALVLLVPVCIRLFSIKLLGLV